MDANNLYSLEVLVTKLQVFHQPDPQQKLAIAVRLLDFPLLLIPPTLEPDTALGATLRSNGKLNFNAGKSCLFQGKPTEMEELLQKVIIQHYVSVNRDHSITTQG